MDVLLDTNVVIRSINLADSQRTLVEQALDALSKKSHSLVIVPQVLYESWVVSTRPTADNGLGLTAIDANAALSLFRSRCEFRDDPPGLFAEWERVAIAHQVEGKAAHDARLVAAMNLLGLTHLLTFNGRHFARYSSITTLDPQSISSTP
jgi:predicted nucleic acid-binding protein